MLSALRNNAPLIGRGLTRGYAFVGRSTSGLSLTPRCLSPAASIDRRFLRGTSCSHARTTPEAPQVVAETDTPPAEVHPIDQEHWVRIYQFPHITTVRFLMRLKVYQTLATMLSLGPVGWAYRVELITFDQAWCMVGTATVALSCLYVLGYFSERLIGAVYENKTRDKVRVAHLTFFGHRKDVVVDADDIMDITDVGEKHSNLYLRVHRLSRPTDPLIVFPHQGGIEDADAFERIFGFKKRSPVFKVTKH